MIFNRIKLNYNIKLLDDLFANKEYQEIHKHLKDLKNNKSVYYNIIRYLYQKYLLTSDHRTFHKNKFVWIVSYDLSEVEFLNKFIDYYMGKQETTTYSINQSNRLVENLMAHFGSDNFPSHPSFDDGLKA